MHFNAYLPRPNGNFTLVLVRFKDFHKYFTGHFHRAHLTHTLFPFFLLFKQLTLTGNVAAVAFCKYVLTHSLNRFTGNNFTAHRRLYGDFKQLTGNCILQVFAKGSTAFVSAPFKYDDGQRVANFTVQ